MGNFLAASLLWIKAFHIISVIAWMAGMFYLPRLYVYHCETIPGSEASERFKVMEKKLNNIIILPAMAASFLFGGILSAIPGVIDWHAPWWHVKLLCVVLMGGFHGALSRWRKDFLNDRNRRSAKFYRLMNEVPTVLMMIIVIMVVVQP